MFYKLIKDFFPYKKGEVLAVEAEYAESVVLTDIKGIREAVACPYDHLILSLPKEVEEYYKEHFQSFINPVQLF